MPGKNRIHALAIGLALAATMPAHADQYWVAYEGNDFPENEGWYRVQAAGGAVRSIEDGVLTLDGLASASINDLYGMPHYPLDPEMGETFRAEWRFGVDAVVGMWDPALGFFSDESWTVSLSFSRTAIHSTFENIDIPFEFSGMHDFSLTSSDMRSYQLMADGIVLREGQLVQVLSSSRLSWGDSVEGAASRSRWDYVRFGVVPETTSACLICIGALIVTSTHTRR